ncbi:hypothetical protein GLAREA_06302 [Glarea lozoyensis ATCC 20868]|uniref:Uncharacterized protein n=1 Tax=Glarea lozoyensis (strain ATCC 20868 / MF5171) TaxID=1116229 RepID=S3D6E6_GLAL2|nr:uncharacterized protein GLAREA_06302 [Glarea lozoyensis ATCC 20868]EPE33290.1 hypothetical protein GLAREA_06302 [Glarea lozoyensis ATCC 20868]
MKICTFSILCVLASSLANAGVITNFDELARRAEKKPQDKLEFDQQTESFKKTGTCRLYDATGDSEKRKSSPDICEATCGNLSDKVRDTNATASMSCSSLGAEAKERLWQLDPDGDKWSPGGCLCQIPLAEFIIDTVAAALPLIDDVLCVGLTTALRETMLLAANFIPNVGPTASAGLRIAVQTAKTVADYGGTAADYMKWFSTPCGEGTEDIQAKADEAFNLMSYLPDELEQALSLCPIDKKSKSRKNGDPPQPGGRKNDQPSEDNKPTSNPPPPSSNQPPAPSSNPVPSQNSNQPPSSQAPASSVAASPSSQASPASSASQLASPSSTATPPPINNAPPPAPIDQNRRTRKQPTSKASSTASSASAATATTEAAEPEESEGPVPPCGDLSGAQDVGEKVLDGADVSGCAASTTEAVTGESEAVATEAATLTGELEEEATDAATTEVDESAATEAPTTTELKEEAQETEMAMADTEEEATMTEEEEDTRATETGEEEVSSTTTEEESASTADPEENSETETAEEEELVASIEDSDVESGMTSADTEANEVDVAKR